MTPKKKRKQIKFIKAKEHNQEISERVKAQLRAAYTRAGHVPEVRAHVERTQRKAFVEKTSKDLQENRWTPFTELSAHEVEGKTLMILLQCGCCVVCGVLDNVREAKTIGVLDNVREVTKDMKDMNEGKVFLGDFAKVEAVFGKKSHGYPLAGDVDDMNGWYVRAARLPSKRDIARCVAEKL